MSHKIKNYPLSHFQKPSSYIPPNLRVTLCVRLYISGRICIFHEILNYLPCLQLPHLVLFWTTFVLFQLQTHNLLDLCHICKVINNEPGPAYTGKTYNVSATGCLKDVPDKAAYMAIWPTRNPRTHENCLTPCMI